jgi:transcriptional regulator with XRE-family HTH domain
MKKPEYGKPMDAEQVSALLRRYMESMGMNQKQFAQASKVSQQYLSDVLAGRKEPGKKILAILGARKAYVIYRKGEKS